MSSGPIVSPAYKQIVHWYREFQQVQQAKPIALLITQGAPDEEADQPKQTDSSTQTVDIIA
jgi:GMP synthase-like glutamine amidotransferase